MQRVLCNNIWREVTSIAKKTRSRELAIAYVTQELVKLKRGDSLIVNASKAAIACGETSAKLLWRFFKRGIDLYNAENLHSKILLLDDVAVIGSCNMSASSRDSLIETALVTDHPSTVSGVRALLAQFKKTADVLTESDLKALLRITVVRRGGSPAGRNKTRPKISSIGNKTWMVGFSELDEDAYESERDVQERGESDAAELLKSQRNGVEWLRWARPTRFAKKCKRGDSVIEIVRSANAKRPKQVCFGAAVLVKRKRKNVTYIFIESPRRQKTMSWGAFKQSLKTVGFSARVGPNSERLIESDLADALGRLANRKK